MASKCTRETLAEGSGFRVERCSCGTVHVTAGALTLRMDAEACEAFAAVLGHAVHELSRRGSPAALRMLAGGKLAEA